MIIKYVIMFNLQVSFWMVELGRSLESQSFCGIDSGAICEGRNSPTSANIWNWSNETKHNCSWIQAQSI